jgi:hypothetical protein
MADNDRDGDFVGDSRAVPSEVAPEAIIDLLGALAYGELSAFDRLVEDARMAPGFQGRVALGQMAVLEFGHYRLLADRLEDLGADPQRAMAPFVNALDRFHALTGPSTWLESLVKAYVGDGLAADFYRAVAEFVDSSTRELIIEVLADTGSAAFAVREVRAALWGRRLVGEALSQTQHVLAERDALAVLLMHGSGDLAGVTALITTITDNHARRMHDLGLG